MKKFITSLPGAIVSWFLALPTVIHALLVLMALDIISGLVRAGMNGEIRSDKSFIGTARKAMQLILVMATAALAWGMGLPIELASAVAGAFCVTELISIVENAAAIGVPIPKVITDLLSKLQGDGKFSTKD